MTAQFIRRRNEILNKVQTACISLHHDTSLEQHVVLYIIKSERSERVKGLRYLMLIINMILKLVVYNNRTNFLIDSFAIEITNKTIKYSKSENVQSENYLYI